MADYDVNYTEIPKPTVSYTVVAKGTRPTTTVTEKGTRPTTTVVVKGTRPTTTIVEKGTSPTITEVPKPYGIGLLAILAQDGAEILCENGVALEVQGTI